MTDDPDSLRFLILWTVCLIRFFCKVEHKLLGKSADCLLFFSNKNNLLLIEPTLYIAFLLEKCATYYFIYQRYCCTTEGQIYSYSECQKQQVRKYSSAMSTRNLLVEVSICCSVGVCIWFINEVWIFFFPLTQYFPKVCPASVLYCNCSNICLTKINTPIPSNQLY